ncbi:MAG TPA: hypothetical protein EYP60_07120 [bacterium (Candidatus Stahlbacteria)]|nr:hypothetical protein [Candidatus Stahlbacteria bacterium]
MEPNFYSVLSGAVTISALHAVLPSHWLPFVLVGRAERWKHRKVLGILTLAGGGHVFVTAILGFIVALIGKEILTWVGHFDLPIHSAVLIVFGLIYVFLGLRSHSHTNDYTLKSKRREHAAAVSLFLMLTLTPCEPMVLIYFAASAFGLQLLLLLTLLMAVSTLGGMLLLTSFAFLGFERLRLPWLDRNERWIIGVILVALGISVAFFG